MPRKVTSIAACAEPRYACTVCGKSYDMISVAASCEGACRRKLENAAAGTAYVWPVHRFPNLETADVSRLMTDASDCKTLTPEFLEMMSLAPAASETEAAEYLTSWQHDALAKKAAEHDPVNNPSHYTAGGIETIAFIEAKLSHEEFEGYCKGNALKYISRAGKKGDYEEDLRKAIWYLKRMLGEG